VRSAARVVPSDRPLTGGPFGRAAVGGTVAVAVICRRDGVNSQAHRRNCRRPQQNVILFGWLLPNRRPTEAILFHYCSVLSSGSRGSVRNGRVSPGKQAGIPQIEVYHGTTYSDVMSFRIESPRPGRQVHVLCGAVASCLPLQGCAYPMRLNFVDTYQQCAQRTYSLPGRQKHSTDMRRSVQ